MLNVYSARLSNPIPGASIVLFAILIHLSWAQSPLREGVFAILLSSLGFLIDSGANNLGIYDFGDAAIMGLAPLWLLLQWGAFSILYERTLNWLQQKYILAGVLGATGGSFSYYSAASLGAFSLGQPETLSLIFSGLLWLVIFPLTLELHRLISTQFTSNDQQIQ